MAALRDAARVRNIAVMLVAGASLAACATHPTYSSRTPTAKSVHGRMPQGDGGRYKLGAPYQVGGVWYVPKEDPNYDETGVASWYGDAFHMKATANGERFDMNAVSAAHTTLPLPSIVEVTNLENGRKLKVRVNDRGPFHGGRVIDLSKEAARQLGFDRAGLAKVRVRYVGPATLPGGPDVGLRYAGNGMPIANLPERPVPYAKLASAPVATTSPPAWSRETPVPAAVQAPPAIGRAELPPVATAPVAPPTTPATTAAVVMPANLYRVQAGAFSDAVNAERAVGRLAEAGPAVVEPVQKNGVTLYRVMLQSTADEAEAFLLRDRVATYGFADARVVRPF